MNANLKLRGTSDCLQEPFEPIRIGIVGGGPGGLMTAHLLQKKLAQPVNITLGEAEARLGGKVTTPTFERAPVRYEAGAAEFYDYSPVDYDFLKELILELGLSISFMGGNTVIVDNQFLTTLDDIERSYGLNSRHALERFCELARTAVSTSEFYSSQGEEAAPLAFDFTRIGFRPLFREYLGSPNPNLYQDVNSQRPGN